jgi:hypothetical protein
LACRPRRAYQFIEKRCLNAFKRSNVPESAHLSLASTRLGPETPAAREHECRARLTRHPSLPRAQSAGSREDRLRVSHFKSEAARQRASPLKRTRKSGLEYTNRMIPVLSMMNTEGTGSACSFVPVVFSRSTPYFSCFA